MQGWSLYQLLEALEPPSEAWLGLVGALLGAAVSGVVSYLLQGEQHRKAAALRAADQIEVKRALAMSLIIKLIRIHTGLAMVKRHIEEEFSRPRGVTAEPWQSVSPMLTDAEPVQLDPAELALLIEYKVDDAFNLAASLPAVHNQVWYALREYNRRREELRAMMPHSRFAGRVGTFIWTEEQEAQTAPLRIEMNDLIKHVYRDVDRNEAEARQALFESHAGLTKALELTFILGPIGTSAAVLV